MRRKRVGVKGRGWSGRTWVSCTKCGSQVAEEAVTVHMALNHARVGARRVAQVVRNVSQFGRMSKRLDRVAQLRAELGVR